MTKIFNNLPLKENDLLRVFPMILLLLSVFLISIPFFTQGISLHPDDHEYQHFAKKFAKNSSLSYVNELATKYQMRSLNRSGLIKLENEKMISIPYRFYGMPVIMGSFIKVFGENLILRLFIPIILTLTLLSFLKNTTISQKEGKALAIASSPFFLYLGTFYSSTLLSLFFLLLSMLLLSSKRLRVVSIVLAGFIFGLSVLVRPNFILLAPVLLCDWIDHFSNERAIKANISLFKIASFIIPFSLIMCTIFLINKSLYGNFHTFGFWFREISLDVSLARSARNILGRFDFLLGNLLILPRIFYYSSPFILFLIIFAKKNKKNLARLGLVLPYFIFTISKPFSGYGTAFQFKSMVSSPVRYLAPFVLLTILLMDYKKNFKSKLFWVAIALNIYVLFFQPIFSLPAVLSEKNKFGAAAASFLIKNTSQNSIILTNFSTKWIDLEERNTMAITLDKDMISDMEILNEDFNIYFMPMYGLEYDYLAANNQHFQEVSEESVRHFRGQDRLWLDRNLVLYKFVSNK